MVSVTQSQDAVYRFLPLVVIPALLAGFLLVFRQRSLFHREMAARRGVKAGGSGWRRPWWGSPWIWAGIAVAMVLLGVFVAPVFLGGVFIVVLFVWMGSRRPPPMDPRTNGHAKQNGHGPSA